MHQTQYSSCGLHLTRANYHKLDFVPLCLLLLPAIKTSVIYRPTDTAPNYFTNKRLLRLMIPLPGRKPEVRGAEAAHRRGRRRPVFRRTPRRGGGSSGSSGRSGAEGQRAARGGSGGSSIRSGISSRSGSRGRSGCSGASGHSSSSRRIVVGCACGGSGARGGCSGRGARR